MVTDAVLDWWFDLVEWFVSLFPDNPMPGDGLNFGWLGDANYFLPLSEMFGVWFALFSLGGTFVGTSLVVWVLIGILRGGATKA